MSILQDSSITPAILLSYLVVGMLWGCTNPFIKHAQSKHASTLISNNKIESETYFSGVKTFITNPSMFIPFVLNQSGSIFYYFIISTQPISIASPICNSMSFIFTAITGYWYFKEELQYLSLLLIGITFVLAGSYICINV